MSLHRSLHTKPAALNQHRNVLTRAERITRLSEQDRFDPEADSPMARKRIARAAEAWLAHRDRPANVRFDVMVVIPWRLPHHLPDAWRP